MKSRTHPVVGRLRKWNAMFESKFMAFESNTGIHGLAKVNGSTLEIMAVNATKPRTGQFRTFISECKKTYSLIRIWAVMNEALGPVLTRYGFINGHDVDEYGKITNVWDWTIGQNEKRFSHHVL